MRDGGETMTVEVNGSGATLGRADWVAAALEILADDVKCAHGATVGRLDDNSLFYFRSRGISQTDALRMLTYAFAGELVDAVSHEAVRALVDGLVNQRLSDVQKGIS